jgi:hypothetical protein
MELNVRAELACAFEITGALYGDGAASFNGPVGFWAGIFLKLRKVFSIEKDDGIARCIAGIFSWGDNLGLGAEAVMDVPIGAGDNWSILVSKWFRVLCEHCGCDD